VEVEDWLGFQAEQMMWMKFLEVVAGCPGSVAEILQNFPKAED
jgi:hypothetical protein